MKKTGMYMKRYISTYYCALRIAILCIFLLSACNAQPSKNTEQINQASNANSSYTWARLTDSAAFAKSYNYQMFSIKDTLWIMHPTGGWYSVNGKDWIKSALTDIVNNNAFLDYVWFNNALYGLGTFNGNIEKYTLTSAVHKTNDMRNWQIVSAKSNLPTRFFYHPFVFNNKIWIIGGSGNKGSFADAWSSTDGINWNKEADDLPFGKRENSQVIVFKNKMYLLNSDVWSSSDAIHWTRETENIMPGNEIFGYAIVVYDDQIWLLGCNRNNIFKNEVIKSNDGKNWTAVTAPWSPRGGIAACVHNNKIFMTGGKYGGLPNAPEFIYSNDVWAMESVQ
jgi:hypothetical protein